MDNKGFIDELSKRIGRNSQDVSVLIGGFSTLLKEKCANQESVAIPGFGTFVPVKQMEYVKTIQDTGKRMLFPPRIDLHFEASTKLKSKLKERNNSHE